MERCLRPEPHENNPAPLPEKPLQARLIEAALQPVSEDLRRLNGLLPGYIPTESNTAAAVVRHAFGSGGKRIRPALYFFACRLLGYAGEHLMPIGAVSELVHTASLLHDDVVDNSPMRRNKPTAHSVWGSETAVLVGDLIYARASEMMAATGSQELVEGFARSIRYMSEGELLQLENIFNPDMSEDRYFRIIECKTAALIGTACRSAGILAGATSEEKQALETFGRAVGIAFQLTDDALDYVGATELFGKKSCSDISEGKLTLPLLLARNLATKEERSRLTALLQQNGDSRLHPDAVKWISALVTQYRTDEMTIERAAAFTNEAINALSVFPSGPARTNMEELAKNLVLRLS